MPKKRHPSAVPARRRAEKDERAALRSAKRSGAAANAAALDAALRATGGAPAAGAADSFQNFGLALGMGTQNALSGSTYGFNPITRNRTLVEWIYRGTWIGGVSVNLRAEDMTRAGIELNTTLPPGDGEKLLTALVRKGVWRAMCDTKKWASLYGGALGVVLVDGQGLDTPLRVDTVGKDSFKGVAVVDRWMVDPSLAAGGLVEELGPDLGKPKFYNVRSDSAMLPGSRIHYTRCLRLVGDAMPFWQTVMENYWGTSIYERIYDRLVAFDSATTGVAQTVYKSYVRTYQIENLRELVTAGGPAYQGLLRYVQMMRTFQGIEGITLLDAKDKFVADTANVTPGMADALVQFGQQICGAIRVPAVRLFGMSPAGLNATGDSDWRNYYDGINSDQEIDFRMFVDTVCQVEAKSQGLKLPEGFGFNFTPLWQMTSQQKAEVGERKANSILLVKEAGLIGRASSLKELRQQSRETGMFTNITDDDIQAAEEEDSMEPPGLESVLPGGAPGAGEPAPEAGGPVKFPRPRAAPTSPSPPRLGGNDGHGGLRARGPYAVASVADRGEWLVVDRGYDDFPVVVKNKLSEPWARELCARLNRPRAADRLPLVEVAGLPILVECPRGERRWPGGPVQPADYGYIRRTKSAEGDDEAMDCFVGPDESSQRAFVVNHYRGDGTFEEHKVMLGYRDAASAATDYCAAYPWLSAAAGDLVELSLGDLSRWLDAGDVTRPLSARAS